jgi:hypothetical protein
LGTNRMLFSGGIYIVRGSYPGHYTQKTLA